MGYLLAIILLIIAVALVAAFFNSSGKGGGSGSGRLDHDKPVGFEEPAAEEPTPPASAANVRNPRVPGEH